MSFFKILLLIGVISVALTGCAHKKLMKCEETIPDNFYFCPKEVQIPFRMCEAPKDVFKCVEPQ